MKKRTSWLILAVFCLALVAGCSGEKLSSSFDQAEVEASAMKVIQMVNDRDGEGLRAMSVPTMAAALNDSALEQVYNAIEAAGAFKEVKAMNTASKIDKDSQTEYAVVLAQAEYEKITFNYTISFTKDMELAGLFFK